MSIDKHSHVPYYIQLATVLRQRIKTATAADRVYAVPSENELASRHHLSRATVRQALALLQREGLIYKEKGKGTFAAKNRARYELTSLIPTTDDMRRRGWRPGSRLVSLKRVRTRPPITDALELAASAEVYELCRVRLGDGEPVCLQWSYLPAALLPDFENQDLTGSLTHIMEFTYGLKFWTAHETLRARRASNSEARLLKVGVGSPVIYMERTTFLPTGQPIEFLESVWRSDRYEFVFSLTRGG